MSSMLDRSPLAALALAALAWSGSLAAQEDAQEPGSLSAEEAIENARDQYYSPDVQTVTYCPKGAAEEREEGADGNVIVVCRQLGPANPFQTREGPRPRMDQTADGLPRAPDFSESCQRNGGQGVCLRIGRAPPRPLLIDLSAIPEAPPGSDAARYAEEYGTTDEAVEVPGDASPPAGSADASAPAPAPSS